MLNTRITEGKLSLSIKDLPSVPVLVADALRVIDNPSSSMSEIEAVIMRDQALAVKVLRVVNSAAYGFSRRIENVREASTIMGTRKIRGLAAAMVTSKLYAKGIDDLVDPLDIWRHSLATSVWAIEIIDFMKLWQAQSAVMAALLHDIGIVLLCNYAIEPYRAVLQMSRKEKLHHVDVEKRELDTTHAFVGASLCAKWLLPVGLTQLVCHHHDKECPVDDALAVLMLADFMAHDCGLKPLAWSGAPPMPDSLMEKLQIDGFGYNALCSRKENVLERADALFEVSKVA